MGNRVAARPSLVASQEDRFTLETSELGDRAPVRDRGPERRRYSFEIGRRPDDAAADDGEHRLDPRDVGAVDFEVIR
jgi:hypothetical protein